MIPSRMQALGLQGRVSAAIFFGKDYNYVDKRLWSVNLKFTNGPIKAEVNAHAEEFEEALQSAWNQLDQLISNGLGAAAMMPALEAPKAETNDKIPF